MSKLIIFTNTYPYGTGETFLHEELPFVADKFDCVLIFPLYIPGGVPAPNIPIQSVPQNVRIMEPLISFDHKDKKRFIFNGFSGKLFFTEIGEFFRKSVFLSGKKLWIYFNYTLLLNSILNNCKVMAKVQSEMNGCNVAYFYWGDKSALLIPYLKEKLKNPPPFVVRFHGSDIYEQAKGYLPYREYLYRSVDYAIPISNNGAEYIKSRYPHSQPEHISVHRLGSYPHQTKQEMEANGIFHIVSCSNVIELKRVEMIASALVNMEKEISFIERMAETGYKKIKWTHIGDGPLLEGIKESFRLNSSFVIGNFPGRIPHEKVIEFYNNFRTELFIQVSRSEGIPVSIMEAISYGIPVIATNVGGVPELFSDPQQCPYGTLLPQNLTVSDLEKAIRKFILLPDTTIENARAAARSEWELNWNSQQNYTAFANFLYSLS